MIRNLLFIFIGGGLGSVLRFGISQLNSNFSYGTLTANLLGSLLIGFFIGLFEKQIFINIHYLTLAVGFCGGFTTFSSFAAENLKYLQEGDYTTFFIYVSLSLILGIAMVAAGFKLSSLVHYP